MPRPKVPGAPEPKKRSRTGCWNCKSKKIKCGEEKPRCKNCDKNGEEHCDFSIRLNWDSRLGKRRGMETPAERTLPVKPGSTGSIPGMATMQFTMDSGRDVLAMPRSHSHSSSRSSATFLSQLNGRPGSGSTTPTTTTFSMDGTSPMISPPLSVYSDGQPPLGQATLAERPQGPSPTNPAKKPRFGSVSDPTIQHNFAYSYRPPTTPATAEVPHFTNPYTHEVLDPSLYRDGLSTDSARTMLPPNNGRGSVFKPTLDTREMSIAYDPLEDARRMSINSLLIKEENEAKTRPAMQRNTSDDSFRFFGIDRGLPDLDIPKNNDNNVLDMNSPLSARAEPERRDSTTEFGFSSLANSTPSYANNMHVKIPKSLLPLPSILLNNPMNLMYFHFFIERTSSILVPHDCPANPFRIILPQMAVRNEDLLFLLLAYSASHRARVLGQPEPTNRIAYWVSDVFTHLRHTLEDSRSKEITPANIATAVMLASLEIVAPGTFGIEIPWQSHLSIARRMIAARGGSKAIEARDRVSHFLIRWFAYLDILGNFSTIGVNKDTPMFSSELYEFNNEAEDYTIDCMLGFSGFLAGVLAKIADLAHRCDMERLTETGEVKSDWLLSAEVVKEAEQLKADLAIARTHKYTLCPHRHSSTEDETLLEQTEMAATNSAYHWAGMIHLHRRVLGLPVKALEIQSAVVEIIGTLYKVRKGSSAEACLIFPLITAGCQVQKKQQQKPILERILAMEANGMTQVQKSRKLLERVWETGQPWETLAHGDFLG